MRRPEPAVLGVVVTYQPDETLRENLQALRAQITCVLVVDNGSKNIAFVECIAAESGCRLIKNPRNLGIAKALNQGAEVALAEGFAWLATFDQDSMVTAGLVQGLLEFRQTTMPNAPVGVLAATHIDRHSDRSYHVPRHVLGDRGQWRMLRTTITSGSFIPVAVLRAVGPFDEPLFIDFVDHDFCVRCRQHGYLIVESKRHILVHSLGRLSEHDLLGRRVVCSNHSAIRRYYMTRNQLEVYRRYLRFDPAWSLLGILDLLIGSAMVLIFESDRLAKMRAMLRGAADFALRRFGPARP